MKEKIKDSVRRSLVDLKKAGNLPAGFDVYMTKRPDARIKIEPGIALSPSGHNLTTVMARISHNGEEFSAKLAFSMEDFKKAGLRFEGLKNIQDSSHSRSKFTFDAGNVHEFTSQMMELATGIDRVLRSVYQHKLPRTRFGSSVRQ